MLRKPSRDRFGHASLNSSTTFAVLSENMFDTPVTFPPGRGRLSTSPVRTWFDTPAITMGTVLVARFAAR